MASACWKRSTIVATALLIAASSVARAAAGDVDPTFGQGGRVDVSCCSLLAIDPSGRPLVGRAESMAGETQVEVRRYTSDGAPDPTFGDGGIATLTVPFDLLARSLLAASDGGVLLAGWKMAGPLPGDIADGVIIRFETDGGLDATFGHDGILVDPRIIAPRFVLAPNGDIVAASTAVARYLPNGSPDGAFGDGGLVHVDLVGGSPGDVGVLPDGRIVLASTDLTGPDELSVFLSALTPEGAIDAEFGDGGVVFDEAAGSAGHLVVQPAGRLLIGETQFDASFPQGHTSVVIAAFTFAGEPDGTFGSGGRATVDLGPNEDGTGPIAVAPDSSIFVIGSTVTAFDPANGDTMSSKTVLVRFTADGLVDTGFGDGGLVELPPIDGRNAVPVTVVVQPDGRPIVQAATIDDRRYLVRLLIDDQATPADVARRLAQLVDEVESLMPDGPERRKLLRTLARATSLGLDEPGAAGNRKAVKKARKAIGAFLARLGSDRSQALLTDEAATRLRHLADAIRLDLDALALGG
jgi:uncharacterized delta-60 repeat protein